MHVVSSGIALRPSSSKRLQWLITADIPGNSTTAVGSGNSTRMIEDAYTHDDRDRYVPRETVCGQSAVRRGGRNISNRDAGPALVSGMDTLLNFKYNKSGIIFAAASYSVFLWRIFVLKGPLSCETHADTQLYNKCELVETSDRPAGRNRLRSLLNPSTSGTGNPVACRDDSEECDDRHSSETDVCRAIRCFAHSRGSINVVDYGRSIGRQDVLAADRRCCIVDSRKRCTKTNTSDESIVGGACSCCVSESTAMTDDFAAMTEPQVNPDER
jgi:hypothetical protein